MFNFTHVDDRPMLHTILPAFISDHEQMRLAMRGIASTVVIVSSCDHVGQPYAITANSFTSVSFDPPTILVCINKNASIHASLQQQQQLVINILSERHSAISSACSQSKHPDRFNFPEWQYNEQRLPYIADAQSVFFCQIDQKLTSGHIRS